MRIPISIGGAVIEIEQERLMNAAVEPDPDGARVTFDGFRSAPMNPDEAERTAADFRSAARLVRDTPLSNSSGRTKVFVVAAGEYDDNHVVGVFSSTEKAREYLNEDKLDALFLEHPEAGSLTLYGAELYPRKDHDYHKWDNYGVHEYELDSLPPIEWCVSEENDGKKLIGSRVAVDLRRIAP